MTEGPRRGVTRGYVWGLIFATMIVAVALIIASWGLISLFGQREPVQTAGIALPAAQLIVAVALAVLCWGLWRQAISLLRGLRTPHWGYIIALMGGAYLIWCLLGTLVGLSLDDTWLSPFAAALALIWGLASLLFWSVLARRVYTDRPTPKWPWEKRGEPGPDWANTDDDPWSDPDRG